MGCCVSTQNQTHLPKAQSLAKNGGICRKTPLSPPPSTEVVKEVLSETPKLKPIIKSQDQNDPIPQKPIFDPQIPKRPLLSPQRHVTLKKQTLLSPTTAEVSEEASEIGSVSESVSTTTTTNTANLTDDVGVGGFPNHHPRSNVNRSPLKQRSNPARFVDPGGGRRDNAVGKSPVRRRIEQSPGRVNGGSIRMVHSRDPSPGVVRRGVRSDSNKHDPGDRSGRRSRSPATRVENGGTVSVGRSPSARRTNPSPSRVRSDQLERGRIDQSEDSYGEESKRANGAGGDESIENPLVSLECFIFL